MTLLRDRNFRGLFLADTASQAGTQILVLAMPLVAVTALHATTFQVGVLAMCQTVAFVLIGLPAGGLVDRLPRRNVMIVSDWGRALALASVPLAWWTGVLTIYQLYGVALALGVFTVFFDVAYQSYVPHLVERDQLVRGNSALEVVRTVAQLGGPSLGGYLVQFVTAPFALVATVLGFAWSALCLTTIRKPETRTPARGSLRIMEGVRFVFGHPRLRRIAGCTATANLFGAMAQPMVLLLLARELGLGAGAIGLIMAAGGLGGFLGALLTGRLTRWLGEHRTLWLAIAVPAPLLLLVPLAQPDWRLGLVVAQEFAMGVGAVVYNVSQLSYRQSVTPDELLGRMNATMRFAVWGTLPLGGLLGGVLGTTLGIRPTIALAGAGGCLAFLWVVSRRTPPSGRPAPAGSAGPASDASSRTGRG
ncbi:MAG: MFS transporter [Nonomuraea sp.]|nr:MFS transporter [Nonomuraea sp.]